MSNRILFVVSLVCCSCFSSQAIASPARIVWKTFQDGKLTEYQGQESTRAVHLPLDFNDVRGLKLKIDCPGSFYIFVDGALVSKINASVTLSMDSLSKKYSKTAVLSIFSRDEISKLVSDWISKEDENYNSPRSSSGFSSFIIGVAVLLLIFITALLRTNPQLTQDYLNITKLFSLRDRDEGQILRITSSVNLLFYFFCSALAALALFITSHSDSQGLSFMSEFNFAKGQVFWQWLLLSVLILFVMMLKLLVSFIVSNLFGWKDLAGLQFFNFIRMVILSLSIIALISLTAFSFGFTPNYFTLLKLACILLVVGAVMIYLKLLARATFQFFHLFFYLCATEVLPLVVLIKTLLF